MRQGTRLFAGVLAAVVVGVVVLIAITALTVALASALGWLLIGRERARKRTEALYRASEQTALTLQQSLLPTDLPDLPSCELAIRFAPAGAGDLVGPGLERSAEQLLRRPASERSADALADALLDEAGQPAEVAWDDVAIVAVRYVPPEHVLDELRLTAGSAAA